MARARAFGGTNKFKNKKTGGYDSKREAKRAEELRYMQRAGHITDLQEQITFVLIPTQRDENGRMIERQCAYKADFVYRKNGRQVVEDTKGFKTKDYIIKRKLMLSVHGIRIVEV